MFLSKSLNPLWEKQDGSQSVSIVSFLLLYLFLKFQKSSGLSEDSTMTMISGKYDEDNLSGRMQHSASIVEVRPQGIKCGQRDIMCVAGWATQGIQPHSSQEDWCVLQEDLPHSLFHFRILFLYQVSGCIERVYWIHIFMPGTMQLRELSPTPRYSSTNDNIP